MAVICKNDRSIWAKNGTSFVNEKVNIEFESIRTGAIIITKQKQMPRAYTVHYIDKLIFMPNVGASWQCILS